MTDTRRRSPWVVDTRALGLAKRSGPGSSHRLDLSAPAPPDTGTSVLSVPEGSDVHVTALLESVSEGVLASGTAAGTARGTCARCLREITVEVGASFRELYAYPDSTTAETTDDAEVPRLCGDTIDLAPLVHDELVLAMPLAPTCRPDCPGLCPECGERMDVLGPDHRHETLDPRWAALAGLLDQGSGAAPETMGAVSADTVPIDPAGSTGPAGPGACADKNEEI